MAENKTLLGMLVVGFVLLILGIVFTQMIANSVTSATQANTITNESINWVANGATVSLTKNQLDSITSIKNSTGGSLLTAPANYTFSLSQGTVTSVNRNGTFFVTYIYRDVGDSTSRSTLSLVVIFIALAVLLFIIAMMSPGFREMMNI